MNVKVVFIYGMELEAQSFRFLQRFVDVVSSW